MSRSKHNRRILKEGHVLFHYWHRSQDFIFTVRFFNNVSRYARNIPGRKIPELKLNSGQTSNAHNSNCTKSHMIIMYFHFILTTS
jgi:hypothetical protein